MILESNIHKLFKDFTNRKKTNRAIVLSYKHLSKIR